jgi:hypothetical protein
MDDQDFANMEFWQISSELENQHQGKYNLEFVLRVKNFKSQAWLKPDPSWDSILEAINKVVRNWSSYA